MTMPNLGPLWILDQANWHPRCLDVEVTTACRQWCRHCYLGKPGTVHMTHDTAELVWRYLREQANFWPPSKPMELNFYGGEAFLNFPIVQYLTEASEQHVPAVLTIFTDGATANPEQIAYCREHHIFPKRSTAGCPQAAALTRPGDYTERWLEEGRLWGEYGATHRLTVTPATAPYILGSVHWLHVMGYYGDVDIAADEYADWSPDVLEIYEDQMVELAYLFVEQFRHGRVLAVENFSRFGRVLFGQSQATMLGCGAPWNTAGINVLGQITTCHRCFREPAGSPLHGGSLTDAWIGPHYPEALANHIYGWAVRHERTDCQECNARQACQRDCLHLSWTMAHNLDASVPVRCRMIRLYVRLARWINEQLSDCQWWNKRPTQPILSPIE